MKAKERHHLKENELAHSLGATRDFVEARRGQMVGIVLVVILIVIGVFGITMWKSRGNVAAEQALANAMVTMNARVIPPSATAETPGDVPAAATIGAEGSFASEAAKLAAAAPKLKAAADAYPDSEPGITARYHYASALASLGRSDEAVASFDDVIKRAGADTLYGRMSRLGKADTQMRAGKLDEAITTWKELATSNDETLPKDAILMELGHAYVAKGNQAEAKKTFTQVVDEHPTSPYTAEARMELESLKG